MKNAILIITALVLGTGCASAPRSRASMPRHQWTDADWYAEATEHAHAEYESEVAQVASRWYASEAEAEAVAQSFGETHFRVHLEESLEQYGLSVRGLRIYESRHPEFAAEQGALYAPRTERIRAVWSTISTRVRHPVVLEPFVAPAEPSGSLASRE